MPYNVREQTVLIKDISYLVRDAYRVEHDVDVLIEGNRIVRIGHTPQEIAPGHPHPSLSVDAKGAPRRRPARIVV